MDGLLNIYKSEGMTSHDVVAILRKKLGQKRIGHSGTLDPMATGVLLVCLGKACRLAEYASAMGKEYYGSFRFGTLTDTLDRTGKVLAQSELRAVSEEKIREAFSHFTGPLLQKAPLYSAVKVHGKKLYTYARQGIPVERPVRNITIYALDLLETDEEEVCFRCACSKGTYIRQLVDDLGRYLGTYASLTQLERSRIGSFAKEDALSIDRAKTMSGQEILAHLLPSDLALGNLPRLDVDAKEARRLVQGQKVQIPSKGPAQEVKVYHQQVFLGIGQVSQEGLKMRKVLV